MATVSVRWRPSRGRGEFEYVPANALDGREILLDLESLSVRIPAEVRGVYDPKQKKPRLRKFSKNDRSKLHLPQLVMAAARLPEPAREDHNLEVRFPLENKSFVMEAMDFEIVEDKDDAVTLAPLRVSILHTNFEINLQDRFEAIANEIKGLSAILLTQPLLANDILKHYEKLREGKNTTELRFLADKLLTHQVEIYGHTNAGSVLVLEEAVNKPAVEIEEVASGKEGKLLVRIHSYKERDRSLVKMAKQFYKSKNGGQLICEACGLVPLEKYGDDGESCIEAHHKTPIEELQPDSITTVKDLAMVCASCHRVIHSKRPCIPVEELLQKSA